MCCVLAYTTKVTSSGYVKIGFRPIGLVNSYTLSANLSIRVVIGTLYTEAAAFLLSEPERPASTGQDTCSYLTRCFEYTFAAGHLLFLK